MAVERRRTPDDPNEIKVIYFWCNHCKIDLKLPAHRRIKNKDTGMVWYVRCPSCRRELIRMYNNARIDPYFLYSEKVKSDRLRFAKDLIQMNDTRFDLLYPHIKRERDEKAEKKARQEWERKNKIKP
jgi:hypothetical protein